MRPQPQRTHRTQRSDPSFASWRLCAFALEMMLQRNVARGRRRQGFYFFAPWRLCDFALEMMLQRKVAREQRRKGFFLCALASLRLCVRNDASTPRRQGAETPGIFSCFASLRLCAFALEMIIQRKGARGRRRQGFFPLASLRLCDFALEMMLQRKVAREQRRKGFFLALRLGMVKKAGACARPRRRRGPAAPRPSAAGPAAAPTRRPRPADAARSARCNPR